MCGIVGCDFDDKALVKRMMRLIEHRGPDQHGIFSDEKVTLGHQRLSIIDLSKKGRQPMSNNEGTSWVVFNGEIYNYKEIRSHLEAIGHRFNSNTDTEVIVHAYDEYGFECVHQFNGDFAFCIYDSEKKLLFLARDRLGIKPLYYYFDGRHFLFASEYKSLLEFHFPRTINRTALSRYVTLRYNYGRETMLDRVQRVLPGEWIVYDLKSKSLKRNRFWQVSFDKSKTANAPEQYFARRTRELLQDAVVKRLMSDVPLGVYLSGGIDSGSIVALMHNAGIKDIKTFSVGFGYGEETDELKYARTVSERFGTDHREFIVGHDVAKNLPRIVWHCDEPLADPTLLPVYLLSQKTKPSATVVLTGDGGDEVFAGYEQNKFLKLGQLPYPVRAIASPAIHAMPSAVLNRFFKYAKKLGSEGKKRAVSFLAKKKPVDQYMEIVAIFNEKERKELSPGLAGIRNELACFYHNNNPVLHNTIKLEYETQLPENMLHKGDRMTMAHAIEARVPFLDHRLVEFSETIPASLKLKGFTEKYIIRKAMQPYLPKQTIKRKKQRFYVPIDRWLATDLAPMADELLSPAALKESGVFNPEAVRRILGHYNSSPLFYARQLWVLLTFQLWHQQVFNYHGGRRK
ncbi:MAG: asparagine synthase (glutamine-hydrolyzing) [Candidatus Woesearchaeota archaeon]